MTITPDRPRGRLSYWIVVLLGLLVGLLIAGGLILGYLVVTGKENHGHIETLLGETHQLAGENKTHLSQQSAGTKIALDILCRLKVYDLVTGSQGELLRELPGSPLKSQREARIIAGALALVETIPSAESCNTAPHYPGVKNVKPRKHPLTGHQIEQLVGIAQGSPALGGSIVVPQRAAPVPRRRSAPHHRRRVTPRARLPARAPTAAAPARPAPASTTSEPSPSPPPPSNESPVHEPPGHERHESHEPLGQEKEPPEAPKKHGLLGICVEALGVKVLC